MTEREVAELRRRFRLEKSNITHVRGCYVSESGEIVSEFDQALGLLSQEESEQFLAVLRRTLSGGLGKNLLEITFETQQVVQGEEHKLLMALKNSKLKDDAAVRTFFERVIGQLALEGSYLILLASDSYDVPFRSKDGARQDDASSEVYSYFLCSICPVKITKPALGYYVHENEFHTSKLDWLVSPPELGFLFPAFDDRSTNLYNALYYTHNLAENHEEFVQAIFQSAAPMPAAVQKETFQSILGDALAEDCSLEVVQSVHEQICGLIEARKEDREAPPLVLSKGEVRRVLYDCGVSESHVADFEAQFEAAFGEDAALPPTNLVDAKRLEVRTPDVTIQVNPERSDLVQTRVIDGIPYLLIRAEEGVEVNGIAVQIPS